MARQQHQLQRPLVSICIILAATSLTQGIHCNVCDRCEKIWSSDDWQTVDCENGSCAKRIASGYTVDVGPFKSTQRFCDDQIATGKLIGCKKRSLNERVNGWLVKMSSIEECWCNTDYCNGGFGAKSGTCLMIGLITGSLVLLWILRD